MKWLRLWTDVLENPKVQDLPAPLFKAWVNLLLLANRQEKRGALPDLGRVALHLRISRVKAQKVLDQLIELGLIDDLAGTYGMHDWGEWQRQSDDAAARMAKGRRTPGEDVPNNARTGDELPSSSGSLSSSGSTSGAEQGDASRETEAARSLRARLFMLCEQEVGSVTPTIADELNDWINRAPESAIVYAFQQAAAANKRSWRYVASILKRLEDEKWPAQDEEAPEDNHWVDDAMRAAS